MNTALPPAEHAAQILEIVQHFTDAVRNGETIVLDGVQDEIQTLCTNIAALPKEEARAFEAPLEAITAALDELVVELNLVQSAVRDELESLSSRKKANTAYRTTRPGKPAADE